MDASRLIKMANDIAAFFESDPDPQAVTDGIAGHLRRFWDPRMRRELLRFIDEHGGDGCKPTVLAAVAAHRDSRTPADR